MLDNIIKKEELEETILINNYNYALNEEFDYLDKEEEIDNTEISNTSLRKAMEDKDIS